MPIQSQIQMAPPNLHILATDPELVLLARSSLSEVLCYHDWLDHRIVKISSQAVVKWGPGVTKEEAENQRLAHATLDPEIVRVPAMYRYIQEDGIGFIVMEFIHGQTLTTSEAIAPGMLERLVRILQYLSEQRGNIPGPFCGGRVCGSLWPDEGPISFTSLLDLQVWLNNRLSRFGLPNQKSVELDGLDLVMCHMDFAPRNLTILKDGSLCLMDWALAGYYPRCFEIVASRFVPEEEWEFQRRLFEERLLLEIPPKEREMVGLVERLCRGRGGEDLKRTDGLTEQLVEARRIEQESLA